MDVKIYSGVSLIGAHEIKESLEDTLSVVSPNVGKKIHCQLRFLNSKKDVESLNVEQFLVQTRKEALNVFFERTSWLAADLSFNNQINPTLNYSLVYCTREIESKLVLRKFLEKNIKRSTRLLSASSFEVDYASLEFLSESDYFLVMPKGIEFASMIRPVDIVGGDATARSIDDRINKII